MQQPVAKGADHRLAAAAHPELAVDRFHMIADRMRRYLQRNGGLPENYEPEVLKPFMETLAQEVTRSLQFFFASTQFSQVDYLLLAGGCSAIPGLDEVVANRTQVSTLIANPFLGMTQPSRIKPKQLLADAPSLLIACGLALRKFEP